ncbi:MAG TPA: hypothetical protein VFA18_10815 [Gemmataceae bacterium]|nr:hypothetical protein [Gemmataceae bacterium]
MKDRRSLVEGLDNGGEVDRSVEEQFVFAGRAKADQPMQTQATPRPTEAVEKGPTGNVIGRVPVTTRVRADFATALKRASLQRQLDGVLPNTLQDILEEALEPWLRSHGYLG